METATSLSDEETSKQMQRTLLLVDDEQNILSALSRLFRPTGYRILTANSGQEGLEILKENDVGVIVSDQRMPAMTGVEFLSQVKELYPDTVRVVLSGYTDLDTVADAINKGAIYKFLTKPWDDDLLRANIEEAFQYYELRHENERLTKELQKANEELSAINHNLEHRVEEKTRELMVNLGVLRVSQDVLEHLPVAVLGIGDDGMVAVANHFSHHLLNQDDGSLVGQSATDVLPPSLCNACGMEAGGDCAPDKVRDLNGTRVRLYCHKLGDTSHAHGSVLVITPVDQIYPKAV